MREVLVAVLLLLPIAARAADDPDTEIARRHFLKGVMFYEAKDYPNALKEFQAARRAKAMPALDFNIGRCHDRLEQFTEAIAAYERYVSSTPEPADAATLRERIQTLKARLAEEQPPAPAPAPQAPAQPLVPASPIAKPVLPTEPLRLTPATPTVTRAPLAAQPRRSMLLPLLVGGVALGVGAAGAVVFGTAVADYNTLDGPGGCRPCAPSQYADVEARANLSYVLWAVAGAAAIADAILWVHRWSRGRADRTAIPHSIASGVAFGGVF